MLARNLIRLLSVLACMVGSGCQTTSAVSKKAGSAVAGIACFCGEAMINGMLGSSETALEQQARQEKNEAWKQHWRDDPNDIPAMTEEYKDDYE